MMSEGTVSELCRVLQKQGYRGDAVSVFADSLTYITSLEAQLAARNQAAEAMGVLGKLVNQTNHWEGATLALWKNGDDYRVLDELNDVDATDSDLIEAVLKAGGEDA